MSLTGSIDIYTEKRTDNHKEWIEKALGVSGLNSKTSFSVYVSKEPTQLWKDIQEYLQDPSSMMLIPDECDFLLDTSDQNYDFAGLLQDNSCVQILVWDPDCLDDLYHALERIPEDIRDNFGLKCVYITTGYTDVVDESVAPSGRYVARPYLKYSLSGDGCPANWAKMADAINKLPEIQHIKKQLEEIAGPMETFSHWA